MRYPKYLIRSDDYTVFSLNDDGKTYTVDEHKKQFPHSYFYRHPYDVLNELGFFEPTEDLSFYKNLQDNYYRNLKTSNSGCGDDD